MAELHLKELEIFGFKSFGEKTLLVFPAQLTVVVGPNGSGKSNVVDAIRWGLGDQSYRNLRIAESSDVIFAGEKKPNFAYVRIAFESENESIEIQRRIEKNGDHEYFINQQSVRLKDIQRVLAEHQIGTKGFTVINQGSADMFIKATPQERHVMLGEILGTRALELKKIETKRNLQIVRERLKIAKIKLKGLQPQAELALREQDKKEKKEQLQKAHRQLSEKVNAQKKYLLKTRLKDSEVSIAEHKKNFQQFTAQSEALSEGLQKQQEGKEEAELQKQESELWKQRSAILEKKQEQKQPPKILSLFEMVKQKLQQMLSYEKIEDMKKGVYEVIAFIDHPVYEGNQENENENDTKQELIDIDAKITDTQKKLKEVQKNTQDQSRIFQGHLSQLKAMQEKVFQEKHSIEIAEKEQDDIKTQLAQLEGIQEVQYVDFSTLVSRQQHTHEELMRIGDIDEEIIKKGDRIVKKIGLLQHHIADLEAGYEKTKIMLDDYQNEIYTRFQSGVKGINQALIEYFHKFYGGTAKLVLEDEQQVHISIDHPEKKVKILEALSGGEKALFSIALIFALIKIANPPFLVLDEIDAALDENNAHKFGEFLKELSHQTQFVVISHNRTTMETGDILYGVSMQKGGSKIFSLKLKDAVKAIA